VVTRDDLQIIVNNQEKVNSAQLTALQDIRDRVEDNSKQIARVEGEIGK
jgi:hypothetical protein